MCMFVTAPAGCGAAQNVNCECDKIIFDYKFMEIIQRSCEKQYRVKGELEKS